jgi:hypothetical protein
MRQLQAAKSKPAAQAAARRDAQPLAAPASEHERWMELQRGIGNQAVSRVLQQRAMRGVGREPQRAGAGPILRRKCACGGGTGGSTCECAECSKRKLGLQTKLRINTPGDVYEQEADWVVAQVMQKPTYPGIDRAPRAHYQQEADRVCNFTHPPVGIQRRVNVGSVANPFEGEADGAAELITGEKGPPPTPATMRLAAAESETARDIDEPRQQLDESESALTNGGTPLPGGLRSFYEQRFGYDFSHVRIHVGDEASRRTQAMNAHAFTFADHVWLGAHQPVARSFVLAHELAHVVQQTQPGAASVVRRAINDPYWVPMEAARDKRPGTFTHNLLVRGVDRSGGSVVGIAAASRVVAEAPVPNANKPHGSLRSHRWARSTNPRSRSRSPISSLHGEPSKQRKARIN